MKEGPSDIGFERIFELLDEFNFNLFFFLCLCTLSSAAKASSLSEFPETIAK